VTDLDEFSAETPSGRLDVERNDELSEQVGAGVCAMADDPATQVDRVVLDVSVLAGDGE